MNGAFAGVFVLRLTSLDGICEPPLLLISKTRINYGALSKRSLLLPALVIADSIPLWSTRSTVLHGDLQHQACCHASSRAQYLVIQCVQKQTFIVISRHKPAKVRVNRALAEQTQKQLQFQCNFRHYTLRKFRKFSRRHPLINGFI